jgi:hypothetical protein
MLDTLFWNTTLRSDPLAVSGTAAAKRSQETNRVLSSGLVAISINGNNITKSGIDFIRRAISTNHWFLGEFLGVTHSLRNSLLVDIPILLLSSQSSFYGQVLMLLII